MARVPAKKDALAHLGNSFLEASLFSDVVGETKPKSTCNGTPGHGSKLQSWGYAGFSVWLHLRCHFGTTFLSHRHHSKKKIPSSRTAQSGSTPADRRECPFLAMKLQMLHLRPLRTPQMSPQGFRMKFIPALSIPAIWYQLVVASR